jgi:hypothetical protein
MKSYSVLLIVALVISLGANGCFLLNQLPQKDNPPSKGSQVPIKLSSPPTKTKNPSGPTSSPPKQPVEDITLKDVRGNVNDFGIEIIGAFTSLKDCHYALVEFLTYDKSGNRVGTAYDIISELKAGEVWNFEARGYGEASTYKFEKAECNNYR